MIWHDDEPIKPVDISFCFALRQLVDAATDHRYCDMAVWQSSMELKYNRAIERAEEAERKLAAIKEVLK